MAMAPMSEIAPCALIDRVGNANATTDVARAAYLTARITLARPAGSGNMPPRWP
jgi:hypothetical protein